MATGKALDGKPYAGNPHVRLDEGDVAPAATPRRGSLLYKTTTRKLLLRPYIRTTAAIASVAAVLAALPGSAATARVELNAWKFLPEEALAASRLFTLADMADWLDDMGRDLMESPSASRRPHGAEPVIACRYNRPDFDDAAWEDVRVPHDAAIRFSFSPDLPFLDAYLPATGTAWYRCRFSVKDGKVHAQGKRLPLAPDGSAHFVCDGAMAYPMVWINGRFVGGWPLGYARWRVDLTPHLRRDGSANVIAVRTHRPPEFSRWHTGLGLTRRCWLETMPADHVVPGSVAITTPSVTKASATVKVAYEMSRSGKREKTFKVENPRLWDVDDPYLHTVDVEGDSYRYGIRTIGFFPDARGFQLNGRRVQIKGCCFHQDLGSLGAVANRSAIRRRLMKAKALGMNAVRMSHYRHAEDWYDLCDELGLLVMDEMLDQWSLSKRPNDYHLLMDRWFERDLRAWIRAERNHPCVVMWGFGNEIWESRAGKMFWPIFQKNGVEGVRICHQEDPTRPATTANDNRDIWRSPLAQFVDIYGFNYNPENYAGFHALWPAKPFFGSETMCTQTSRGEYFFPVPEKDGKWGLPRMPRVNFRCMSYGFESIRNADYEWTMQDANPACMGSFTWTAFDYLGGPAVTPALRARPNYSDPARQKRALEEIARHGTCRGGIHSCPTGLFDLAGFAKDEAYLYRARWLPDVPQAHILPHWTWPGREGEKTPVHVYSSGDEVELFVNGVSQGRKAREKGLWRFRFNNVTYQPGEVTAVAYKDGRKWADATARTAGAPARLVATPERTSIVSDGEDVGYVTLKIVDKDGNFCPTANIQIVMEVAGNGRFLSAENGDETDFTWLRDPTRKTSNGLLSALVRATPGACGEIAVTFSAEGLPPATARIAVTPAARAGE